VDRLDSALFEPTPPRVEGYLQVDELHSIYWAEYGTPDGAPLVILHGGPGSGSKPFHGQFVDPARHRGIVFDQRGCGRSTPRGSLEKNSTQNLVADMEALRIHLGIDRWIVAGGSWGSALALTYAETHPERCLGLVLFGVIVERREDLWWWWEGTRFIYPEVWEAFRDALPPSERSDMRANYIRRVLHPDPAIHRPAAAAWIRYESQTLDVLPDETFMSGIQQNEATSAAARIFAHYDMHDFFLEDSILLRNAGRIANLPGFIVNGRFDMCTPPRTAYDLHKLWPGSELVIAPGAGHRWTDPLLSREIMRGISRITDVCRP